MMYVAKVDLENKLQTLFVADNLEWCKTNLEGTFRKATKQEIKDNVPYSAFMENINGN